jgi:polar amino acid transport system substrate-binding protein
MIARFAAVILACLASAGIAAAQTAVSPKPDLSARNPHADPLRGGWYPWDPYQYRDYRRGVPVLTGFDVEIERALERILGVEILLPETAWNAHLEALAAGTADIAAGATRSEARSAFAYFSKPYRSETDVLILPKGAARRYAFSTIDEMLESFAKQKFRLGVVAGFVYADSRVNAFIADPTNEDFIVPTGSDAQNLQNLLAGITDGFLADRIAAATTAWRLHQGARIEEHGLRFSTDIHFMLSRATQTPQMLARLDAAIDELQRSGEFRRIAALYALPVLINQTLDSDWFRALLFIGTIAFAFSGVVLAYAGQYSLFGALILATLPALGGGVVRDLLLQRDPLGIVRNPEALLIVFATVLAGMVVIKTVSHIRAPLLAKYLQSHARLGSRSIEAFDAVALAAFTVVGVVVVLDTSARPLWLWGPIAAVLTASFGGLMRDMLRHDRVVANLRGELYPEIAAVWGLAFAIFLEWEGARLQPEEIRLGVIVTILGVFRRGSLRSSAARKDGRTSERVASAHDKGKDPASAINNELSRFLRRGFCRARRMTEVCQYGVFQCQRRASSAGTRSSSIRMPARGNDTSVEAVDPGSDFVRRGSMDKGLDEKLPQHCRIVQGVFRLPEVADHRSDCPGHIAGVQSRDCPLLNTGQGALRA